MDVQIRQMTVSDEQAEMSATVFIESSQEQNDIFLEFDGEKIPLELREGMNQFELPFAVDNPILWQPP